MIILSLQCGLLLQIRVAVSWRISARYSASPQSGVANQFAAKMLSTAGDTASLVQQWPNRSPNIRSAECYIQEGKYMLTLKPLRQS
jgi:hypothetical protein